jgi:DNA polymerase-3 subunit beta
MKLKVPKNSFDKAIKSVAKAVPNKGVQPILNNILLENENGHLKLNATDLDFSIEAIIPSDNEESGKITISAKKLEEIVSKLDEDDIHLEVEAGSNKTNLTCKKSNFELVGVSAEDFPKIEKPDTKNFIKLNKHHFSKMINMTHFSSSKYDLNNILGGILFSYREEDGKKIFEVATTDGNRLSSYEYELDEQAGKLEQAEVVIPAKVILDVQKIIESSVDDEISISFLNNQVIFFTQDRYIISRLIEGSYPRYKQLIPDNQDKLAQINTKQFISCLERVATMANEITNLVKLTFKDNKLYIQSSNQDYGQAEDDMAIHYEGDELSIFFNVKYLIEPIKHIDSEEIVISMSGSVNPALIKPKSAENYIHLVMPIKHDS